MDDDPIKYFLNKNQWDWWVKELGKEWVEENCILSKPLPLK